MFFEASTDLVFVHVGKAVLFFRPGLRSPLPFCRSWLLQHSAVQSFQPALSDLALYSCLDSTTCCVLHRHHGRRTLQQALAVICECGSHLSYHTHVALTCNKAPTQLTTSTPLFLLNEIYDSVGFFFFFFKSLPAFIYSPGTCHCSRVSFRP